MSSLDNMAVMDIINLSQSLLASEYKQFLTKLENQSLSDNMDCIPVLTELEELEERQKQISNAQKDYNEIIRYLEMCYES